MVPSLRRGGCDVNAPEPAVTRPGLPDESTLTQTSSEYSNFAAPWFSRLYAVAMTINEDGGSGRRGPYAKSAERRRSIVEAAHSVFAAQGYRGGSLQDVADLVGMSQTSLLHYFPSKRDLLLAVLNLRDSIVGDGSDSPVSGDFVDAVLRQARYNESHHGVMELYTVLCAESLTDEHPGRDFFVRRFSNLREAYTAEFTALARDGRLRDGVDPAQAASSLVALWDGIQTQWLLDHDSVDVPGSLLAFFELVLVRE